MPVKAIVIARPGPSRNETTPRVNLFFSVRSHGGCPAPHVTLYLREGHQASLCLSRAVRATFCSFVCVKKCHSRHFSLERQIFTLWRITLPQSTHHLEEGSPATNLIQWVHRMSRAVQKYVSTARVQNFNHLRLPSSMERTAAVMFYMLFLVRGACWQYFSPIR